MTSSIDVTTKASPLPVARAYLTKWIMALTRNSASPANEKELSMLSITDLYRRYTDELDARR